MSQSLLQYLNVCEKLESFHIESWDINDPKKHVCEFLSFFGVLILLLANTEAAQLEESYD